MVAALSINNPFPPLLADGTWPKPKTQSTCHNFFQEVFFLFFLHFFFHVVLIQVFIVLALVLIIF